MQHLFGPLFGGSIRWSIGVESVWKIRPPVFGLSPGPTSARLRWLPGSWSWIQRARRTDVITTGHATIANCTETMRTSIIHYTNTGMRRRRTRARALSFRASLSSDVVTTWKR